MALSDIVNVSISATGAPIERAGFGIPLVLACDCPGGFAERVRSYSDLTGLLVDFASSTVTYKMVAAAFAQNPKPPTVMVGRVALPPTQTFTVLPVATNSTAYTITVDGHAVTYTSDSSATVIEITAGLKTLIDALALTHITTTDNGAAGLVIACTTPGEWHSVSVSDVTRLGLAQDHADPGAATDLAAINLENSGWYCVLNPFNSKAHALAIAGWVEANPEKIFVAASPDSKIITLALSSDATTSLAGQAKSSSYFRTSVQYHALMGEFEDAALAGAGLPLDPGSETWAFKTLAGVTADSLTATQRANATQKNCGIYESIGGRGLTNEGKVAAGEFIDVIRFRDWLVVNMRADVLQALANAKKIPFTDAGISVIEGIILARLSAGVSAGGLSSNPAPVVTAPAASSLDKSTRKLTGVKFDAVLAGAIQAVTITGTVTA